MSQTESVKRETEEERSRREKRERRGELGPSPTGAERRYRDRRERIADRRTENNIMLATFYLAKNFFGIPVSQVQEILLPQKLTPVPLMADYFRGLMNLRGQIVPAIDLQRRINFKKSNEDSTHINLIVHSQKEELYSFMVERVGDVVEVDLDYFEPPPMNIDPRLGPFTKGVCKMKTGLLIVLNVDSLVKN